MRIWHQSTDLIRPKSFGLGNGFGMGEKISCIGRFGLACRPHHSDLPLARRNAEPIDFRANFVAAGRQGLADRA
nr:hypothetical protein [Hyphomonas sp.]